MLVDEDTFFECSQESCQHVFQYTPPVLRGGENEARPMNSPSSTTLPEERSRPIPPRDPFHELPTASSASRPTHTIKPPPSPQFNDPESFSPPEEPFSTGPFF